MKAISAIPPPYGYPSSKRGDGSRVPYLTKSRKIWIESSLFCRRLELYEPWEGEPSGLGQCVTMSLLSEPYQGEWNHTNEKKTFGDLSYVLFSRAPKTFKNVVVPLTCFISTSPHQHHAHTWWARCAPLSFYPHSFTLRCCSPSCLYALSSYLPFGGSRTDDLCRLMAVRTCRCVPKSSQEPPA